VLQNAAATVAGNVWAVVVGAVTLPLILRGLGAEAFGLWVLVQTFSALTGWLSLADLGLRVALVREIAEPASTGDHARVARVTTTGLALFALIGIIAGAALATLGPTLLPIVFDPAPSLRPALEFAIVCYAIQAAIELALAGGQAVLEGLQRVDRARAVQALRQTAIGVATAVVAIQTGSLRAVAVASLLATIGSLLVAGFAVRATSRIALRAPSARIAGALLRYGTQVGLVNATGVVHRTMDRWIVGATFGPAPVALVEIATQVQNGAQAVLTAASYSTTAAAPWLRARADPGRLRELLVRGTRLSVLLTVPAVVVATVLAGPIVDVWMGVRFGEAAGLTAVAALSVAFAAPLQVGSLLLQGIGRATDVLRAAASAVVVNLGLSLVLVRVTGVIGVFQATLAGSVVLALPLARAALRATATRFDDFVREALRPAMLPAAAATTGAAVGLLAPTPLTRLALGTCLAVGLWSVSAWRFALTSEDRAHLRDAGVSGRRSRRRCEPSSP